MSAVCSMESWRREVVCSRFAWVSVLARRDRAVLRVSSSWPCSALLDVKHKCWRSRIMEMCFGLLFLLLALLQNKCVLKILCIESIGFFEIKMK